jgi:hypothetical protein
MNTTKKNWRFLFALILAINFLLLVSCGKDSSQPIDFHYNYFPLKEGQFAIYSVHEEKVDPGGGAVNNYEIDYFIKTKIGDTLIDNSGRVVRKFERYVSDSATGPWQIKDVWTAIIADNRAELVEENNRVIKLVFAPTEEKTWNINAFNTLSPIQAHYSNIHQAQTINGLSFPLSLVVQQENTLNLIQHKRKYEVYAKNVGMIAKVYKDAEITNFDTTQVTKGFTQIMQIVDFGIE